MSNKPKLKNISAKAKTGQLFNRIERLNDATCILIIVNKDNNAEVITRFNDQTKVAILKEITTIWDK